MESADDVLSELQIPLREQSLSDASGFLPGSANAASALDKDYEMLLDALGFEPASIDVLAERTGLRASRSHRCC